MNARTTFRAAAMILLSFAMAAGTKAQTAGSEFQQAVAAYQQSPTPETATAVIKMAAAMHSSPPVPEEARKHFVRGSTLFKGAKSPEDYGQVIDEFQQAVQLAPWWPEARYNWALAFEAAGSYADAIANLKLYLLFKLPEADARAAQDKVYALETMQEQTAKAKADADAEQQRVAEKARVQKQFLETTLNHSAAWNDLIRSTADGSTANFYTTSEVSKVVANLSECRIDFHSKASQNNVPAENLDLDLPLRNIQTVLVWSHEEFENDWNARNGRPWNLSVSTSPPITVVTVRYTTGVKDEKSFFFADEYLANRVATAIRRAAASCGRN